MSGSTRQSYESVWMSRWIRTTSDIAEQTRNPIQTKTFEIVNESLKTHSKGTNTSIFKYVQNTNKNTKALRPVFPHSKGTSKNPPKWSFAMPKPLQEIALESSSDIVLDLESRSDIVFKQLPKNGCPRISQMLITRKTDVKENDIFKSTRAITKVNGDRRLSSFFGRGKREVKLQALSSEGKEKVGDVKASKVTIRNESSAETDTMDMGSFKDKNTHHGAYSTTSTKTKAFNTPPQMNVNSSRQVGLPDINLELPASLSDNTYHADPSNRWVKRLKLNSSNSFGTKNSNLAENPSREKMSVFFSKILKSSITSSEPKEAVKGKELLMSHAWIQRWLSNNNTSRIMNKKKPESTLVVCDEPQSSKLGVENLQKEMFPSIAAMALMGKAITGFQPCELKKRGPFTVWKTKAF